MDRYMIDHMLNPTSYTEPTSSVQHLQTHISHIFLTDRYVYKIKKAVNFGFLDFTTIEKRCFFCNEELRLNRRLSPDIYLEVIALYHGDDGVLSFRANGPAVEYAVKMIRMPEGRMLSRLLEHGDVTEADISAIAVKLASFHAGADKGGGIELFGTVEAIRSNWLENLRQTLSYCGRTLSEQDHGLIGEWALQRLEQQGGIFQKRLQNGFIRECHGDLHSDNICLDGQVHIFDCIEFNEEFRFSDIAADVAFLAMDLENHGRQDLALSFISRYQAVSGDSSLQQVLPVYLANRAFIRGKVESFRLDDAAISDDEKQAASKRAKQFFRLARGYVLREQLPRLLFLTCGPTGCGKTAVADELAFQLGLRHLSSDVERKRLAGVAPTERGNAIYGADWNRATYDRLFEGAREYLTSGACAVVDATFRVRADRERFIRLATESGVVPVIVFLACPEAVARERLDQRKARGDSVSDGTWQVYQQQRDSFELPTVDEALLVTLDATLEPVAMVDQLFDLLRRSL